MIIVLYEGEASQGTPASFSLFSIFIFIFIYIIFLSQIAFVITYISIGLSMKLSFFHTLFHYEFNLHRDSHHSHQPPKNYINIITIYEVAAFSTRDLESSLVRDFIYYLIIF